MNKHNHARANSACSKENLEKYPFTCRVYLVCSSNLLDRFNRYRERKTQTSDEAVNLSPHRPSKKNTMYRVIKSSNAHQVPNEIISLESNQSRKIRQDWKSAIKSLTFATVFWGKREVHSLIASIENLTLLSQHMNDKSKSWTLLKAKRFPETRHVITRKCNTKTAWYF